MQELVKHFFRIIFFTIIFISLLACGQVVQGERQLWGLELTETTQLNQNNSSVSTEGKEIGNQSRVISSRETSEDSSVPFVKIPEDSTLLPGEISKDLATSSRTIPTKPKPPRSQPKDSAEDFADSSRFKKGSEIHVPKDFTPSNPPLSKPNVPLDFQAYEKAVREYKQGNYKKAFSLLEPLAYQGQAQAQNHLGIMYHEGQGIRKNYKKAFDWFTLAAHQQHPGGLSNLGVMHDRGKGIGIATDTKKAIKLYKQSAAQGWITAYLNLGHLYYYSNVSLYRDHFKAFQWFFRAVDIKIDKQDKYQVKKQAEARYFVGYMYYYGEGVEKDLVKAREWLVKSANEGNQRAKSMLSKKFS